MQQKFNAVQQLTPHIGYVTAENYQIFYSQMIESLEACVNGKPIRVIE